ncbi:protein translocase subunit secA [Actinomadura pelletieri DSM 43383]|uniref:Protein translocase subunit SecA n=1 Tax=Actinomadura pelletieri DSM 43383 TaxID=1120940 RepID=A0A495QSF5_9ACTN|nr:preprotein translocase subunit SecA [Actinomadura pelletieri]RKS76439.1 protein translocase subunit secA [Actinomadura pelletieri DSM 43383]
MPPVIDKILRAGEGKVLRKLKKLADQVNSIEEDYLEMSDAELREQTDKFKEEITEEVAKLVAKGKSERDAERQVLDELLPYAFATAREAAKRVLGQRHFDVQIMGGAALHMSTQKASDDEKRNSDETGQRSSRHVGYIAEMRTGEGKTLTCVLPAYLNALTGKGVHVVTVNDYLAKRDAEWMGRVHQFLGLEVGVVLPQMTPEERRAAYNADITYGTNNEFGFDYLRDNMAWSLEECVQRGHNFAIVDEVDSILIDEARTPLIISGPAEQNSKWYPEFAKIAPRLKRAELISTAGQVDEYGPGDYEVNEKKRTVGITESGVEKVEDWLGIDNLYDSVNTPLVSFLNNALKAKELYKRDKDYVVMNGEVLIVDEFTGRILHGRRYNEGMHQAIEAKEGVPIKDENQTLATITLQNYFRLYNKLSGMTGTAVTEAAEFNKTYKLGVVPIPTNKPMVREDVSDVVYKTEQAKFEAVVDDIAERHEKGQPVLVGTTSVEKSEKLSKMLKRRGIPHQVLNAKNHEQESAIVAEAGRKGAVTVATNMAGRGTDIMLGGNPDFRADLELHQRGLSPLETPDEYEAAWPEALKKAKLDVEGEHEEVVELGGLYVLGTERHESRRIDNQLRGRSGRQGDPGESRFYLSLEDDLMRLFNSARVESIMTRLNIPDDVPIESRIVTNAIRSAQSQVEQQNFEVRKNVLKYDEVLNRQRKVIYAERRKVLEGEDLHEQVRSMIDEVVAGYVAGATAEGFAEEWDLAKLWKAFEQLYPISITVDELVEEVAGGDISGLDAETLAERIREDAQAAYDKRDEELGSEVMRELERRVVLNVLDRKWREHLYEMDYLQEGIGLRAMAQRDPLVEYQREGYDMFNAMLDGIKEESVGYLFHLEVEVEEQPSVPTVGAAPVSVAKSAGDTDAAPADELEEAEETPAIKAKGLEKPKRPSKLEYSAPTVDGDGGVEHHSEETPDEYAGVNRNDPCPCGSGKKFKRCHGDPRNKAK